MRRLVIDKQVSLKKVFAVVGVLAVLGGTFHAGMAYENHRIVSGIEDAFSDSDEDIAEDDSGDNLDDDDTPEDEAPVDPVEIKDKPLVVELGDEDFDDASDRQITFTLTDVRTKEASGSYEDQADLTRNLVWSFKRAQGW